MTVKETKIKFKETRKPKSIQDRATTVLTDNFNRVSVQIGRSLKVAMPRAWLIPEVTKEISSLLSRDSRCTIS
jgi:hypothetical protein